MKILSHRGYWKHPSEKNTSKAFTRSFELGFGTETDIRDFNTELVISHDIAHDNAIGFDSFLAQVHSFDECEQYPLALNIKADGLAPLIQRSLRDYRKLDCFVFDLSVPEMRCYLDIGIPVFTRMSEVEKIPVWLNRAAGVWVDCFESDWVSLDMLNSILQKGKRVCLVSPELHSREHSALWSKIKPLRNNPKLMLCTDLPEHARQFFERH